MIFQDLQVFLLINCAVLSILNHLVNPVGNPPGRRHFISCAELLRNYNNLYLFLRFYMSYL